MFKGFGPGGAGFGPGGQGAGAGAEEWRAKMGNFFKKKN
jgi:hypothetical protein